MTATLILDVLLEASVRSVAIATLVALALSAYGVKPPPVRHGAWTAVLAAMLLLPAASVWLPTMPVPEWMPAPAAEGWVPAWVSSAETSGAPDVVSRRTVSSSPSTALTPAAVFVHPESARAAAEPASAVAVSLSARGWLVAIWLAGAAILLLREAAGWWLARRLVLQCARLEGTDGAGELFQSNRVTTPVVVGVWTPRILVPESWPSWGADVRHMVVLHERAHISRRDPLVAAAARVNRSVFWFHPLAWWLERHLSRGAERACDEVVVREVQDPRHYAGLLVEMARRLQRHGGRVAWQGIGIVSSRRLEERINDVLAGPTRRASWLIKWGMGLTCFSVITVGAACERETHALAPDPEIAKSMIASAKRMDAFRAAAAMTPDQVSALERTVTANPEDMDATRDLLDFYQASGQKVLGWDGVVAARRTVVLRLIERHPDSYMANWPLSRRLDPVGYDAASALWAAHLKSGNVKPEVLVAAVRFYEVSEPFVAERLLLRAHEANPNGPPAGLSYAGGPGASARRTWLDNLGNLYGKAVLADDPVDGRFAQHAARQLDETTRAEILLGAGNALLMGGGGQSKGPARQARGLAYFERAATLDPDGARTQRALTLARSLVADRKEMEQARELFGGPVRQANRAAFDKLSDAHKLTFAHELLWGPYVAATGTSAQSDQAAADAHLAEFKRRVDVIAALATSPSLAPDAAARLTADVHIARGSLALRQGNKAEALKRLQQAAAVGAGIPPGKLMFVDDSSIASGQAIRLTWELLDAGERESVASFYDIVAKTFDGPAPSLFVDAAAAIRAGKMPREYQMAKAQEYNAKNAAGQKIAK